MDAVYIACGFEARSPAAEPCFACRSDISEHARALVESIYSMLRDRATVYSAALVLDCASAYYARWREAQPEDEAALPARWAAVEIKAHFEHHDARKVLA